MELWRSKTIDAVEDVENRDALTLDDLNIMFHTGNSKVTGFGPDRTVTYRTGFACNIGNVKDDVWQKLTEKTTERVMGEGFLEKVEEFVRQHGLPTEKRTEDTVHQAALELCAAQLWKSDEWDNKDLFEQEVMQEAK